MTDQEEMYSDSKRSHQEEFLPGLHNSMAVRWLQQAIEITTPIATYCLPSTAPETV